MQVRALLLLISLLCALLNACVQALDAAIVSPSSMAPAIIALSYTTVVITGVACAWLVIGFGRSMLRGAQRDALEEKGAVVEEKEAAPDQPPVTAPTADGAVLVQENPMRQKQKLSKRPGRVDDSLVSDGLPDEGGSAKSLAVSRVGSSSRTLFGVPGRVTAAVHWQVLPVLRPNDLEDHWH